MTLKFVQVPAWDRTRKKSCSPMNCVLNSVAFDDSVWRVTDTDFILFIIS